MNEDLKKAVLEIGELVKQLPESIQEKAFEMRLAREVGDVARAKHDKADETQSSVATGVADLAKSMAKCTCLQTFSFNSIMNPIPDWNPSASSALGASGVLKQFSQTNRRMFQVPR